MIFRQTLNKRDTNIIFCSLMTSSLAIRNALKMQNQPHKTAKICFKWRRIAICDYQRYREGEKIQWKKKRSTELAKSFSCKYAAIFWGIFMERAEGGIYSPELVL